jgi:mono/diheme cytochrome c family protein
LETRAVRLPALLGVTVLAVSLHAGVAGAERVKFDLPKGPGRDLVYGHCQTCHDLQSVVDSAGIRRGAWNAVLDNMEGFGLRVTDDQRTKLLEYLATYLGPNPPAGDGAGTAPANMETSGRDVFENTCIACHQADGLGKAGKFPPLAGNTDIFLTSDFPAIVVLNGIEGPLTVKGQHFENAMPSFDFLSDDEIAAVLTFVRSAWGNDKIRPAGIADVTAAEVTGLRAKPMTGVEVHALRESLLK